MRLAFFVAVLLASAAPALAQTTAPANLEGRVGKIERELRAVQRKVFPGQVGATVEPEITTTTPTALSAGQPASAPIADLTARVDALERTLATLTGQSEENAHKAAQTDAALAKFKADAEYRLTALEAGGRSAVTAAPVADGASGPFSSASTDATEPARKPSAAPVVAVAAATSTAALASETGAKSGDPGEDAYMAAYRLWEAKQFPQAQDALKAVVAKYPKHARTSYAKNLLGRAYLDDGKPALAAQAFLDNYQKDPKGDRAPDSLYYLGASLTELKKLAEACKVYDELQDVYGASLRDTLKSKIAPARQEAKCAS